MSPSVASHETIPCPSISGQVGQTVATTVIAPPSGLAPLTRMKEPRCASFGCEGQLPSKSAGTGTSLRPGPAGVGSAHTTRTIRASNGRSERLLTLNSMVSPGPAESRSA